MRETFDIRFKLWQIISNTFHLISKARQKELYNHGVSMYHSAILDAISRLGEKATPIAISKESSRERHTVSEHLTRMEKEELIKKVKDLKKKNLIRIELTEKGYELFQKASDRESIDFIMGALTLEEQWELWTISAKLRDRAMEYLGLQANQPYPPSDLDKLLPHNEEYPTNLQSNSESLPE